MLIKFIHSVAGDDFKYGKGLILKVSDEEGLGWIQCGSAVLYAERIETATPKMPIETRIKYKHYINNIPEIGINKEVELLNEIQTNHSAGKRANKSGRRKPIPKGKRKH